MMTVMTNNGESYITLTGTSNNVCSNVGSLPVAGEDPSEITASSDDGSENDVPNNTGTVINTTESLCNSNTLKDSTTVTSGSKSARMGGRTECSVRSKRHEKKISRVKFSSTLTIHPIPHVCDMSNKEKSRVWFNADDFREIERESNSLVEMLESGKPVKGHEREIHPHDPHLRGLEKLIYRNAVDYFALRREALSAVLNEQAFSRRFGSRFISKNSNHSNSSNSSDDRIAHAYKQTSMISRIRATDRGNQDYLDIKHYIINDPNCQPEAVLAAQKLEMQRQSQKKKSIQKKLFSSLMKVTMCETSKHNLQVHQSIVYKITEEEARNNTNNISNTGKANWAKLWKSYSCQRYRFEEDVDLASKPSKLILADALNENNNEIVKDKQTKI